jgi:hypothetical protein
MMAPRPKGANPRKDFLFIIDQAQFSGASISQY